LERDRPSAVVGMIREDARGFYLSAAADLVQHAMEPTHHVPQNAVAAVRGSSRALGAANGTIMLRFVQNLFRSSKIDRTETPDLSWLDPPCDMHDVAAWDHYWREQAAHGLPPALFDLFSQDDELVDEMRQRGLVTVLCAGCGISQEPRALAHAGMTATALDTSRMAIELARTFPADEEYFKRFFRRPEGRPGGSIEFVVGDFRDPGICPGPFHVVIERRTVQLFSDTERSGVLEALAARLASNGIFISHFHSGSWRPGQSLVHPAEPWFVKHRFTLCDETGRKTQEWPGIGDSRSAWLFTSTG
jgi:SAM-dependent methyltransferase